MIIMTCPSVLTNIRKNRYKEGNSEVGLLDGKPTSFRKGILLCSDTAI